MNRTFSILLYPKKSKAQSDGTVPIYLRITIDQKPKEISTKVYIDHLKWNRSAQRVKGKTDDIRSANNYLRDIEQKVHDIYRMLSSEGKPINAEIIKNHLLGKGEKERNLLEIIKQHNKDIKALIGNGYAIGTYKKYLTTEKHLTDFIKWKYSLSDFILNKLNYEFISDFEFFLKAERHQDINTSAKYIKNFKKIVKDCLAKGWLVQDPFISYKSKSAPVERGFLTEHELNILQEKKFNIERIEIIKDLFLFSCYTGLSYIDVYNLTKDNISIGIDGMKWIFTHRQKTETASRIPLLPPAEEIIEKYKSHPKTLNENKLLPLPSNQKCNAYLKEIADCCSIKKQLTFHIARHTFATTVTLSNGVPIESVSKMLGHKKIQTTQHYAKILDKKVSGDMRILINKYKSQDKNEAKKSADSM